MSFSHKKHLGQNFLKDTLIKDRIFLSIPSFAKDLQIVEIGTGLGDLTQRLLDFGKVVTYEIDKDLEAPLRSKFDSALKDGSLEIRFKNIMDSKDTNIFEGDYFLVANLPYYVATAFILKALKDKNCKGFLVMIQKEVALKFCALSGQKEFCALSVLSQSLGEIKYLFDVEASCFEPVPKVDSAVIYFVKTKSFISDLESLLRQAFKSPRKMLFKNLEIDKKELEEVFIKLNLSLQIRPHQVSTDTYIDLLNQLQKVGKWKTTTKEVT
ncbi:16S rRNA (adenine(1518)-N(6)/adenine(1519)-N(6))-dimethyltransferase RsmA [Helicobacter sp. 11S02629-2]|uniref:16S rRNA (adenine(1518)-N(6)/adenine(1519)-N(6))- dimethyltransferase RsmA n=1 Tax=Helicobacter sp. 11S02629-2 TaxID=1476195 RepID=UPI000BA6A0A5|nr:16S rRNA (adenine(1518)-N(6)/adenine(1519)-N(6))-dimethyltransferase RsmA [Helicobacter sp. 11S02629-2]PAF43250.1 hypothetical protein BKH40_07030 [Helicobacter sp. 11S02629-2]